MITSHKALRQKNSKKAALGSRRILLIDDELHFRLSAACLLANWGYQVSEAADGAEALAMILDSQQTGRPFDLVITDIILPRITGLTLLKNLQMQQVHIPVLVITGYLTATTMKELHQMSYREILVKPFKATEFQKRVEELFAREVPETRH
jgi:DNA-binding NtrC family response regulator